MFHRWLIMEIERSIEKYKKDLPLDFYKKWTNIKH